MDDARVGAVVIAAEVVVVGLPDEVGRGHGDVLVPAEIGARAVVRVIHAVVGALGDGEVGHRALGVVGDDGHVGREEGLVVVVDVDADVDPPEEGLDLRRAVVELDLHLEEGFVGIEADADHALHPLQRIVFAEPDGDAAVVMLFDDVVRGHIGRGAVVLGPVVLDAAGHPRAEEADQGRFDRRAGGR